MFPSGLIPAYSVNKTLIERLSKVVIIKMKNSNLFPSALKVYFSANMQISAFSIQTLSFMMFPTSGMNNQFGII